jgi:hypothetical protein
MFYAIHLDPSDDVDADLLAEVAMEANYLDMPDNLSAVVVNLDGTAPPTPLGTEVRPYLVMQADADRVDWLHDVANHLGEDMLVVEPLSEETYDDLLSNWTAALVEWDREREEDARH